MAFAAASVAALILLGGHRGGVGADGRMKLEAAERACREALDAGAVEDVGARQRQRHGVEPVRRFFDTLSKETQSRR